MPFFRVNSICITYNTPPHHPAWKIFREFQSDNPEDIIFAFQWIFTNGPLDHPGITSQHGFFAVHGNYDMSHDFFYTILTDFRACDWDPKFVEEHFNTIINEYDDCIYIKYTHSYGNIAFLTFADVDRAQQFRYWLQCQLAAFIPMTPKNAAT